MPAKAGPMSSIPAEGFEINTMRRQIWYETAGGDQQLRDWPSTKPPETAAIRDNMHAKPSQLPKVTLVNWVGDV